MRGPVAGIPPLLQPVAHALLQAREEVQRYVKDFPEELLWIEPAGMASVGFHLRHLSGVLDRLFTYAQARSLTNEQIVYLKAERSARINSTAQTLVENFSKQVDLALEQLKDTPEDMLLEPRGLGRQQIPTTVQGLLFHAAEHTQRHVGQLLVTTKQLPVIQTS